MLRHISYRLEEAAGLFEANHIMRREGAQMQERSR